MNFANAPANVAPTPDAISRGPWQLAWRRIRHDPAAVVAIAVIVLLVALAVCAPLLAQLTGHSPDIPNVDTGTDSFGQPLPPGSPGFLLGSDNLGRDILVRVAYGTRVSLFVGFVVTILATVVGVVVGLVAGYAGGWLDTIVGRFVDVVLSFPFVLVALALASVVGPSIGIAILVIAFFSWAAIARVVRGQALSQRRKEYVEAARSIGSNHVRIMFVDILPNLLAPVIVLASLLIPTAIIFEASLSFLGLGVVLPTASWGNMMSEVITTGGYATWWIWLCPSLLLLLATLAFNILGDSVRDALDARTERLFAAGSAQR